MENTPILRSLVAGGRSSGTGRPTSSTSSARDASDNARRGAEFDREVERARADEPQRRVEDRRQRSERAERSDARTDARGHAAQKRAAHQQADEAPTDSQPESDPATPVLPSASDSALELAPEQGALELESFHAPKSTKALDAAGEPSAELTPGLLDEVLAPETADTVEQPLSTPGAASALAADVAPPASGAATTAAAHTPRADFDSGEIAPLDAAPEFDVAGLDANAASAVAESELHSVGAQSATPSADATLGADAQRAPAAPDSAARTTDAQQSAAPEPSAEPPRAPLDSERAADVLRQVRLRFSPELRQAVIQLEPRELGRISIKISVARGVVRTELRAESASALEALERHAPELQAALERVGLGGGSFALTLGFDGSSAQHASDGEQQRAGRGAAQAAERAELEGAPRALAQRLAALSGVDTYA